MDEMELKELSLENLIFIIEATLNKGKASDMKPEFALNIDGINVLFECDDGRILDAEEFCTELAYSGVMV